ncbi:MAG TPA: PPE family protein [Mycobacterium sp.]|nr:PPE family protein [Mycobacterium sp.]
MVLDFAALPPEINSARMYTGAGAGPLMAAASSWNGLSSELSTTAASYQSVISQLTGAEWQGPSSAAMAAAAEPYIAWLSTTSGYLQHAASQATASAAAYETAFAATVPPPVIAANRAQLAALVATNILGQNTPAIAATEAQYGEMWAQDAAAMYGYAGSSAIAAQLSPLTPPVDTTNPAGPGVQAAAVSQATASSAQTSGLNGLLSNFTNSLGSLSNPLSAATGSSAAASDPPSILSGINSLLGVGAVSNTINDLDVTASWNVAMISATFPLLGHFLAGATSGVSLAPAGAVADITPLGPGLGTGTVLASAAGPAGSAGFGGAPVLAGMGSASSVGGLSVPAGWAAATPAETGATLAGSGWAAAAESEPATVLPAGMPSAASAGRGGYGFAAPRYGVKPTVMPKTVLV